MTDSPAAGGEPAETFESLRPLLFSIAYRMLGSVTGAEDIVQDAFVRYEQATRGGATVESPRAYLSAVVTRLAIDEQRSARARREAYVGQWLPEPLLTDGTGDDPVVHAEQADSLSMAFLLVLERLSPVERAVFLLHDVFGYGYDEVAGIVGKREANCRQLAARARRHLDAERPRFDASREARDELATRFFAAVAGGDVDDLVGMLAADAVVYGDGGGKAPQWSAPIVGAERVARLLAAVGRSMRGHGVHLRQREVNGQPGALVLDVAGQLTNVFVLDIADGAVQTVRSIINPEKLRHIGPVADVRALLRRGRSERPAAE
ncbi:MAG TPA: RNA polymerase sigma-70 factor [Acidimicrobiales bacterium]|nr:RNA polymerase sigma-70 factor [Acidimicrobiales bacterium]